MTLLPGVTFHDGTPMNATAVARNFQRAIGLGSRAGAATIETTGHIAAVESQGEDIVRLKPKAPNGQMPYLLSGQPGMMVSPASFTADAFGGSHKPVGAGPYRIRSYEASARRLYERFDAYWGGTEGRPRAIEHHFVPDRRARLNAVRSGQATMTLLDTRQVPDAMAAGLVVLAMVAEVGIRIDLEVIDLSQYRVFRLPPKRGDVMMGRWGGRADPLQTFQELTGAGGSVNARRLDPADPNAPACCAALLG